MPIQTNALQNEWVSTTYPFQLVLRGIWYQQSFAIDNNEGTNQLLMLLSRVTIPVARVQTQEIQGGSIFQHHPSRNCNAMVLQRLGFATRLHECKLKVLLITLFTVQFDHGPGTRSLRSAHPTLYPDDEVPQSQSRRSQRDCTLQGLVDHRQRERDCRIVD